MSEHAKQVPQGHGEWEIVHSGDFHYGGEPRFEEFTRRLRVGNGWVYQTVIITAIGPQISQLFVYDAPFPDASGERD